MGSVGVRILCEIDRHGGEYKCLSRLVNQLDIDYSNAWLHIRRLERKGQLTVQKSGRELLMALGYPLLEGKQK